MAGITPATISVEEVSSGSPVDTKRLKTFIQRHLFPRVPLVLPPETPRARRHAIPSGPWPWVDFSEVQHEKGPVSRQNSPTTDPRKDWKGYPQSLFPNWQPSHIRRSRIEEAVRYLPKQCTVRFVDILANPPFTPREIVIKNGKEATLWEEMHKSRPKESRLRAVFLDRPSGPVLQMIGTKYNIEPFFWSSSLNRLPSRYQEEHRQDVGDHITVTLLFMSIVDGRNTDIYKGSILPVNEDGSRGLLQELLAVHLIRNTQGNTIITFHPNNSRATSARHLQSRIVDAGRSVYWTDILENTNDPTFILLIFMWYAIYAWDQALEELYDYISRLEERVTERFDTKPTKILHNIHAHLLSYQSLLRDFTESIHFILDNRNPSQDFGEHEVKRLQKECRHLLSEVERLEMGRQNYQERLKNAMNMLFSTVNINDSNQMRKLTQVAVRDSRAMKQVSILTMIFLPASFAASAFGMNITLLTDGARGTLAHYVETAIPLTILTIWFIVASQTDAPGSGVQSRGWHRLAWPYRFVRRILLGKSVIRPTVTPNNSIVDLEAQVVDDEEGDQKGRGI